MSARKTKKRRSYLTAEWLETEPGRALVADLGTASDRVVAEYHGVGKTQVTHLRQRLDVESHRVRARSGSVTPRRPRILAGPRPRLAGGRTRPADWKLVQIHMGPDEILRLDALASRECRSRSGQALFLLLQALADGGGEA